MSTHRSRLSRGLLVCALLASVSFLGSARAQNLIGYWTFDDGDTTDAGGIQDRSHPTDRHNATLMGGGVFDATDVALGDTATGARSIDCTQGDHYAIVDTFAGAAVEGDYNIPRFSASVWFKGWPAVQDAPIISKRGEGGNGWQIRRQGGGSDPDGGNDRLFWRMQGTPGDDNLEGSINVKALRDQWNHLLVTYDGVTRRTYLNGELDMVGTDPGAVRNNNRYLTFGAQNEGARGDNVRRFAKLKIDDVAFWDEALGAHDAQHLAMGGDPTALPDDPVPPTAGWIVTSYHALNAGTPQVNSLAATDQIIAGVFPHNKRDVFPAEDRAVADLSDGSNADNTTGSGSANARFSPSLPLPGPLGTNQSDDNDIAVRGTGTLRVNTAGTYSFAVWADDYGRIRADLDMDGLDVNDAEVVGTSREFKGTLTFSIPGDYAIELIGGERAGGAGFEWKIHPADTPPGGDANEANGWFLIGQEFPDVDMDGTPDVALLGELSFTGYRAVRNGDALVDNRDRARRIFFGEDEFETPETKDIVGPVPYRVADLKDDASGSNGRFNFGNANPGEDNIRLDLLTDGAGITELNVMPAAGDTVNTDFGGAAGPSSALVGAADKNPGGVPTWNRHDDTDDLINLGEFYGGQGGVGNSAVYGVTYLEAPAAATVEIGIGSDDSIQVFVNQEEVLLVDASRGWGGGNEVQNKAVGVQLQQGLNRIMVKVLNGGGGFGFRLRAQTADDAPLGPDQGYEVGVDPTGNVVDGTFNGQGFIQTWLLLGAYRVDFNPLYPAPYNADGDTNQFMFIARGVLRVNTAGTYAFASGSDDSQVLAIDLEQNGLDDNELFVGQNQGDIPAGSDVVILDWNGHGFQNQGADVTLAAGDYAFSWVGREGGGGSGFELTASEIPFATSGLDPARNKFQATAADNFHRIGDPFPDVDMDGTPDIQLVDDKIDVTFYKSTNLGNDVVQFNNFDNVDRTIMGEFFTRRDPVTEMRNVINTWEHGTNRGRFADFPFGNESIPGVPMRTDDYAIWCTGILVVPQAGDYTFGTQADDEARVFLDLNRNGMLGDEADERIIQGGGDRFKTVNLMAGDYLMEATFRERGGDSRFELFAAAGAFGGFGDTDTWALVGDEVNGLEVKEAPVGPVPCNVTVACQVMGDQLQITLTGKNNTCDCDAFEVAIDGVVQPGITPSFAAPVLAPLPQDCVAGTERTLSVKCLLGGQAGATAECKFTCPVIPEPCTSISLTCSVIEGDPLMVRAEVTRVPDTCNTCAQVRVEVDGSQISPQPLALPEDGVLTVSLPDCAPGPHELRVTCTSVAGQPMASSTCNFTCPGGETNFIRGNVDAQGTINISDPIFLLSWLFQGGATPTCLESGNVDGQGTINISDPIFLLSWLFQGGPPPPAPFPDCGLPDTLPDPFNCESFPGCP